MNPKHLAMLMEMAYPSGILVEEYEEAAHRILSAHTTLMKHFSIDKIVLVESHHAPKAEEPKVEEPLAEEKTSTQMLMDGLLAASTQKTNSNRIYARNAKKADKDLPVITLFTRETSKRKKKEAPIPELTLLDREVLRVLDPLSSYSKEDQVSELQKAVWKRWPNCSAVVRVKKSLERLVRGGELHWTKSGNYVVNHAKAPKLKIDPFNRPDETPAPVVEESKAPAPKNAVDKDVLTYLERERVGIAVDIVKSVMGPVASKSKDYYLVARTLSRLVESGKIFRVRYGVYAATKEEAEVLRGK